MGIGTHRRDEKEKQDAKHNDEQKAAADWGSNKDMNEKG